MQIKYLTSDRKVIQWPLLPQDDDAEPDVVWQNHTSVWLLFAKSDAAAEWINAHVPYTQTWGTGIVVEPHYVDSVDTALQEAGFLVLQS